MKKILVPLLFACLCSTLALCGDSRSVFGTVRDKQTGEALVGANVLVVGTTIGAATDLEGKYTLRFSYAADTLSIRVSLVGYAPTVITHVSLGSNSSLKLDVDLTSTSVTTEEVVVTAQRQLSTESAMLAARKIAPTINDGFTMEQIKRTPDATSADALRRVTGISIVDNKFVFVRGVTDRYNSTQLNGVDVTSTDTDVDKKSFSYDMIPAGLLENTVVAKTMSPDLPGDFTGGLVQLNTLSFPEQRVLKLGISGSVNNKATFKSIWRSQGGARDWTGFDDGARNKPQEGLDQYQLGKSLPNNWAQRSATAPLNTKMELAFGDQYDLGGDQLGFVSALSYGASMKRVDQDFYYEKQRGPGLSDTYTVLWGAILDLNFKFGGTNKISFKNSFNQDSEDKIARLLITDDNDTQHRTQITSWDQRSLYVTQLSGSHVFPGLNGTTLDWRGSYNMTRSRQPDRKTLVYAKNVSEPDSLFHKDHTDRSWADLGEFGRALNLDITVPVEGFKVKLGGTYSGRERYYGIKFFVPEQDFPFRRYDLLFLPSETIYNPENFGSGMFHMATLSSPLDEYDASMRVKAGYVLADVPFTIGEERFRVVGGVRVEDCEELVNTISPFQVLQPYTARLKNTDKLPSLNFTYEINAITNLRFAYGQSVNRPEFRELASFYFYDYSLYQGAYGNPLLRRALVKNWDVRLEMFPDVGEVLAFSGFYKDITDAIEERIIASSNPERTWFNSPHGRNYGFELELRKGLGFLGSYLKNSAIIANFTRIYSDIEYTDLQPGFVNGLPTFFMFTKQREMQGQSPYLANLAFHFQEPNLGTNVSILANLFGKRLDAVGDTRAVDIFEIERTVIDLAVSQSLTKSIDIKFSAQDITAAARKYETRDGQPHRTISPGSNYGVKISVSL
jgi:outer membrane cobalamin receptor